MKDNKDNKDEVLYFVPRGPYYLSSDSILILCADYVYCLTRHANNRKYDYPVMVNDDNNSVLYDMVNGERRYASPVAWAVWEHRKRLKLFYPRTVKKAVQIVKAVMEQGENMFNRLEEENDDERKSDDD